MVRGRLGALTAAIAGFSLVAACGITHTSTNALSAAVSSGPSGDAVSQISLLWSEFFNAGTPEAHREALLQDGPAFHDVLVAEAAAPLSAVVNSVAVQDATHAAVAFSLRMGQVTRLPSVAGAAVLVNGHWLVSKSTMCVVLAAAGQRSSACS